MISDAFRVKKDFIPTEEEEFFRVLFTINTWRMKNDGKRSQMDSGFSEKGESHEQMTNHDVLKVFSNPFKETWWQSKETNIVTV